LIPDANVHSPAIACNRDIVRAPADGDSSDHLACSPLHYVQYVFRLAADVKTFLVRGRHNAVRATRDLELTDGAVFGRVDNRDIVPGAVGYIDVNSARQQRSRKQNSKQAHRTLVIYQNHALLKPLA